MRKDSIFGQLDTHNGSTNNRNPISSSSYQSPQFTWEKNQSLLLHKLKRTNLFGQYDNPFNKQTETQLLYQISLEILKTNQNLQTEMKYLSYNKPNNEVEKYGGCTRCNLSEIKAYPKAEQSQYEEA